MCTPTRWTLIFFVLFLAGTAHALPPVEWDGVVGDPQGDEAAVTSPPTTPFGRIVLVTDRAMFVGASTIIRFDDAAHHDPINDRYVDVGIVFDREDGCCIHAYDVCACGYDTTSPPNMACATRGPGAPWIGTSLVMRFDRDIRALGFVIGNDRSPSTIYTVELLDGDGVPIGAVWFAPNGNIRADEFVGVASPVPFRAARVSHTRSRVALCLDDVTFSSRALFAPAAP